MTQSEFDELFDMTTTTTTTPNPCNPLEGHNPLEGLSFDNQFQDEVNFESSLLQRIEELALQNEILEDDSALYRGVIQRLRNSDRVKSLEIEHLSAQLEREREARGE
jgi:hypothetical protein